MDERRARTILADAIADDNGLYSLGWYLGYSVGDKSATLDGEFTAEELEAIVWWINNKGVK